MKKIILVTLTIIWMSIIFIFSNQGSVASSNNSQSFVQKTIINIYKIFDNNMTKEKEEKILDTWEYPVRKMAHFTEFFILGVLIFFTLKAYDIKNIYIMILICFLYAVSDEIHQLFIVGRDCKFFDVVVDTLGSTSAICILNRGKLKK